MGAGTITITGAMVEEALERILARELPRERIEEMAAVEIEKRVGLLTLEEARVRLGCSSVAKLRDLCRAMNVPIVALNRKKQFIRTSEIERVLKAKGEVPGGAAPTGTRVGARKSELGDRRSGESAAAPKVDRFTPGARAKILPMLGRAQG
jgi:hypothetical protein